MNDISIRAAAEYMLDNAFFTRLQNDNILTLKDSYVLVEMSYFNAPFNLYDMLFEIQLKGLKPILAHPERYSFYHNKSYLRLMRVQYESTLGVPRVLEESDLVLHRSLTFQGDQKVLLYSIYSASIKVPGMIATV